MGVEEKLDIISQLEKVEQTVNICHNVRLAHSSIRTIRDNADRIKESSKSRTKVSTKRISYSRCSIMEHVEKMLRAWIQDQNQCHVPISKLLVQAKARTIYEDLSRGDDSVTPFNASTGWFSKFTKRYNFHNIKMTGEAASADIVATEKFVQELQQLFRKEVSDLNKFSTSLRLLCSGRRCLPGLKSLERKNQHLDLRLPRTDLCCFWLVMLRGL